MSFNPADFTHLLDLLGRTGDGVRIGYQRTGADFQQQLFPANALPTVLTELDNTNSNAWFEINPSSHTGQTGRSSATDITRLAAVWADLDFKATTITDPNGKIRVGGLGDEQTVLDVIDDIARALGTEPAAIVYTGGGMQPYWPMDDLLITDENRGHVQAVMKRWGAFVKQIAAQHGGGADGVFDLPRVFRIPGTRNHKSAYGQPRPVTAVFAEHASTVDFDQVEQMLDDYEIEAIPDEGSGEIVSPESEWDWASADCIFVDTARTEIQSSTPQARHAWGLKWASLLYGMIRGGCITEASFYELRDGLAAKFTELCKTQAPVREVTGKELNELFTFGQQKAQQWPKEKLGAEMRNHVHTTFVEQMALMHPEHVAPVTSIFTGGDITPIQPIVLTQVLPDAQPAKAPNPRLLAGNLTDTGNAERLAESFAEHFIYVPGIGWHEFEDGRWMPNAEHSAIEFAKDITAARAITAGTIAEKKWLVRSLSAAALQSGLKLASSIKDLRVNAAQLDASPYELCTPGGIVNLKNRQLRPANPAVDFHTKQTYVAPDWNCPTPKFNNFLRWAIEDDERISYLQRVFGIAALGTVEYQQFPIFLGVGSNGKTTVTNLMVRVFGDYAATMPARFLIDSSGDRHPTDIARLRGIRLAISNEVPPQAKFNEELIKALTGEETLTARFMGEDFFEFRNTATHVMTANHLPTVLVGGRGFWRRIRKFDFHNRIADGAEDKTLVDTIIATEAPGIMAWIVDGAANVLASGERSPMSVVAATQAYRFEEDALARFCDDQLLPTPNYGAIRDSVYNTYKTWCIREGSQPMQRVKFDREILMLFPHAGDGDKSLFAGLSLQGYRTTEELLEGAR